jgi:HK97 family phage major capsid protein
MSMELLNRQFADYHTEAKAAAAEVRQAHEKTTEAVGGLADRMKHVEQQLARRGNDGDTRSAGPDSLGRAVVTSDHVKSYLADGARGSVRIVHEMKTVTSASNSAGAAIAAHHVAEVVALPYRRPTVVNQLAQAQTASNIIEVAVQSSRTNAAAMTAEAATKPESSLALTPLQVPVRTLAHWLGVSRQAFDDAEQLRALIDQDLRAGLDAALENEVLHGDGTGQHLNGLVTQATAFAAPFPITGATAADILLQAIAQAELSDLPATAIILNSGDWSRMMSLKDSTGQYIGGGPWAVQEPRLWGLPVVATPSMEAGDFLVGNLRQAATLYTRMATEVLISSEHADFWIRNLLAIRAELRCALVVKQPAALIFGSFPA